MKASLKSPPTSSEVARRAGVSRTTVSFVLNNVRDQGISEATREKVLAAARDIGYEPNAAARTLAGGSTSTVALVIPKAAHLYVDVFLAQLVASINDECHRHGLKMLIESSDDEGREPGAFVDLVRSRSIDGLIVVNPSEAGRQYLASISDAGIPLVVFGTGLPDMGRYHTTGNDTSVAAKMLVNHLVALGHTQIAFVNFAQPEYLAVNERERGWREAMADHGLPIDPAWCAYADISAASGYRATQELLARKVPFTALFAGNDTIAFGAIKALKEANLRVPEDVALVGYDDIPMAEFATPPLTTVRTDTIGLCRDAMAMLLALLRREPGPATPYPERAVELVVRESCGVLLAKGKKQRKK
nr:LacI family DNA-binding transcriptional regulator [uncultured Albidiferax sp.]